MGEKYGIEVLHLDCVHWLPGWNEREREEELSMVSAFLDTYDSWVIDGNYSKLYQERRLEEADIIIELLFGRIACYIRARKRLKRHKGTSRPDMTQGCEEKVDWEFTRWIFKEGLTRKVQQNFRNIQEKYSNKTLVITNQKRF